MVWGMAIKRDIPIQDIQIVIPMSGEGARFREAGYAELKPLIPINKRPIIDYVASLFPGSKDMLFLCRDEHLNTTNMESILRQIRPDGRIIAVKGARKGPVYAVSQAYDHINDDQPVIISYCDFYQEWDYTDFGSYVNETGCDGAIPSYIGFHPHLLHENNFYATCRVDSENRVQEVREKHSFTANKQEGPQSSGIYYFRSGALMKTYFNRLMAQGPAWEGEYYASLVYTHMIADGLDIRVYDKIPYFCQWGTPQDMEEFLYWRSIFAPNVASATQWQCAQTLIPMAGAGSRFAKEGYATPKPLIPINGKPMVVAAREALPPSSKTIFICQQGHLADGTLQHTIQFYMPGSEFIAVDGLTEGQACTCMLAKERLDLKADLLIGACDNGMIYDPAGFTAATETADCLVFTFRNNPTVIHKPQQYGWVAVKEDGVTVDYVSVKKPISSQPLRDHAIVGGFWFRQAGIFIHAAERMLEQGRRVNGEFYVDELINDVIALGYHAQVFEVESYICWGTPDDLRTYEYWQGFFRHA